MTLTRIAAPARAAQIFMGVDEFLRCATLVSTTPPGLTLRTPDQELPVAFPGDLLTIEVGGTLQVKNGDGSASAISSAAVISLTGGTLDASPIGGLALNPAAVQTMNFPGRHRDWQPHGGTRHGA